MLFTSFLFAGLVLITFLLYYLPFLANLQVVILIISSLIFYAYHQPLMVLVLLLSVAINIVSSYYVVYGKRESGKAFAVAGISLNLMLLIFFKYSPLVAESFFSKNDPVGEFLLLIPLPLGISFFTFQGISLVSDVYTEKYCDNKSLVPRSFLLHAKQVLFFKGFFPQLISGPIVKAHDFIPQISRKRISKIQWDAVAKNIITGYFLKMVVADNLKDFTTQISYPGFQGESSLTLITMIFGFSFQIFADFAGYSLIAIGLARLFGYDFKANFNFPYISASFAEFWKRWHISLSSFLKEYLYIPIGGNRKGKFRTYINLMIVMFLGGLWHGAAWSYAVWGSFHGLALVIERSFAGRIITRANMFLKVLKVMIVFCFVTLAWLLFKLPVFSHVIFYFKAIGNNVRYKDNTKMISYIILYSLPVVIYHAFYLARHRPLYTMIIKYDYWFYGTMLFLIIVNSGTSTPFIYFQF